MKIKEIRLVRDNTISEKPTYFATLEEAFDQINRYTKAYYRKNAPLRTCEFRVYLTFEDGFKEYIGYQSHNDNPEPMTDMLYKAICSAEREAHSYWLSFEKFGEDYSLASSKRLTKLVNHLKAYELTKHGMTLQDA
jgi:hypothetical protein